MVDCGVVLLQVKLFKDDSIVHTVDVSGKSKKEIEKIIMGLSRKMDLEKYYIDKKHGFKQIYGGKHGQ